MCQAVKLQYVVDLLAENQPLELLDKIRQELGGDQQVVVFYANAFQFGFTGRPHVHGLYFKGPFVLADAVRY